MSMSAQKSNSPGERAWNALIPTASSAIAAGVAIPPFFGDFIRKTYRQTGQPVPRITLMEGITQGLHASRVTAGVVAVQTQTQQWLIKIIQTNGDTPTWTTLATSAGCTALLTSPGIAAINGKTMGWSVSKSFRKFTPRQFFAIAWQEAGFLGGLSAADRVSSTMKQQFGDLSLIDYAAPFVSGSIGSLIGQPGNFGLTASQSQLPFTVRTCMRGCVFRARGIGGFSVVFKVVKDSLNKSCDS